MQSEPEPLKMYRFWEGDKVKMSASEGYVSMMVRDFAEHEYKGTDSLWVMVSDEGELQRFYWKVIGTDDNMVHQSRLFPTVARALMYMDNHGDDFGGMSHWRLYNHNHRFIEDGGELC